MSLTDARLAALAREILRIRNEIGVFRDAVRTLDIGIRTPAAHERELLRATSVLEAKLTLLRPRLESVAAQIPALSRSTQRKGSTSGFGHLGNIRGHLPLVERELAALEMELQEVGSSVRAVMNDPLRTSTVPTGGLSDLLDVALELTGLVLKRMRSRT